MLKFVFLYFLFALILGRASYRIGGFNYGARWNGYGSTLPVIRGQADAPMQYRPMIPFLLEGIRRIFKIPQDENNVFRVYCIYEPLRFIGMWLNLVVFHLYLAFVFQDVFVAFLGTVLLALFWVGTFLYDYSDCFYEGIFWGLTLIALMLGNWWLAMIFVFIGTLNKETMIFLSPMAFFLTGNLDHMWLLAAAFAVAYALMFFIWGYREHYHKGMVGSRWMFAINWRDFKLGFSKILDKKKGKFRIFYYDERTWAAGFVLLLPILFFAGYTVLPDWLLRMWIIVPVFVLSVFAYARIIEVRVYMPLAYILIPTLLWGFR